MSTIQAESTASSPSALPDSALLLIDARAKEPIRAELLGLEHLEALARRLAAACVPASPRRAASPLLRRFEDNGKVLGRAHRRILREAPARDEGGGLEAEWLVDNYHIIEDVLREVRQDLPPGYDEELPKLAAGALKGYPRVYALALALVAHTDGELHEDRISGFVQAFQAVSPLTIGELWAVPIMLRLVLLENLRRLADQMRQSRDERQQAQDWAARNLAGTGPGGRADPFPCLTGPFVVRLRQLALRAEPSPVAAAALERLEAELARRGDDPDEVLRREHDRQAANPVSIGNCVVSLRLLSAIDWNTFFEEHSRVEAILRADPAGVYPLQDFATRDRYRKELERIARWSGADQLEVARRVVELAGAATPRTAQNHVGFSLIGPGQGGLKAEFGSRPPWRERLLNGTLDHPEAVYFGSIAALWVLLLAALATLAGASGANSFQLALTLAALLLPAGEVAVRLVNHLITLLLPPRTLPKMDFLRGGIPDDCATFVVMPSMLTSRRGTAELLERLEIHYLADPDPNFVYALLTDYADAPHEHLPEDRGYLDAALEGIRALNRRYAPGGPDKFFLLHRHRQWNPVQGCWMGWERKRGKLSEFNRLLRGTLGTSYSTISGDLGPWIRQIRFVITLDADTQVPRNSARRMVATLAHPLNQPRFDPDQGRVVAGYGILQPRVGFHLLAPTRSRFSGILAASAGIDPYATAVSDHYMDLFGTGSFTGKGIYDVDAFEAATGSTFPENRILSHDLIEGNYARCGLVTDVELFDDFPARYHAYARREHRWVRGDWQILPWLGRRVPTAAGGRVANPLPVVERWKIFDNLRRSLVPPALVVLLALGWTVLPGSPWLWTAAALAVPALPLIKQIFGTLVRTVRGRTLAGLRQWRDSVPATATQALLATAFLADQARLLVDATARTLVRLYVTRRNLLEWETAAATESRLRTTIGQFYATMWPAPALAVALLGLIVAAKEPGKRTEALLAAGPILAAWFVSPVVAFWVSRPRPTAERPLADVGRRALRRVARKTWLFFETFVGDDDHWLPPDNFQEEPDGRVAHRTSPTNQGLLLLSTLAAHDLGYIGLGRLVERLEQTFATFDRMERRRGHFYNWYETRTLRPLPPLYISTVDSGNLLGCLVALKQGLREKAAEPILGPQVGPGLADALGLAREALAGVRPAAGAVAEAHETFRALEEDLEALGRQLDERPGGLLGWDAYLERLDWGTTGGLGRIRALAGAGVRAPEDLGAWMQRLRDGVRERRAELDALAPWLAPLKALEGEAAAPWPSAEAAARWAELRGALVAPAGLAALAARAEDLAVGLTALAESCPAAAPRLRAMAAAVRQAAPAALLARTRTLAERAEALGAAMDFEFLYKSDRHLFTIGYNQTQDQLDEPSYDLLASESCLTSYLAVARGDAPRRHWFQLGRPFLRAAGRIGLISWGGTMFEYLMPRLLLRSLPGTLLDEAIRTAVARQVEYGRQKGVPWGISESAYSAQYADGDYQYQAFGVPGLGLKRGLDRDLVIAPYATALAVAVVPHEALENFRLLAAEGAEGPYGFYEAIDYTPTRMGPGGHPVVVRSYMAHHQGMSLVALANALLDDPMPRRFHAEPMVRSADLLLQERIPRDAPLVPASMVVEAHPPEAPAREDKPASMSRRVARDTLAPRTVLLSNARGYGVMLTNAGSGVSTCRGLDVTRWREDVTRDCWGQFIYVRDPAGGPIWSAGYQPTGRSPDPTEEGAEYEVTFSADKATFRRREGAIETVLDVVVAPESLAECRRVTLTNRGTQVRELELTSYAEVVLAPRDADAAHPAFGKLFLETEWLPGAGALLCRRRPRAADQKPVWAVHVSAAEGADVGPPRFETDRSRFLGRGRTPADPAALDPGAELSGTTGPVLDPILSLRRRVRLEPGTAAVVAFTTAVADSPAEARALADQYRDLGAVTRAFDLAYLSSQVEHHHRDWDPADLHQFQRLAAHVLYAGGGLRADPDVLAANQQGQPGLWRYGISGDRPIVLAHIAAPEALPLARQLLVAHQYLGLKGLRFDLLLLDEAPGEPEGLLPQLRALVRTAAGREPAGGPGGVFVLRAAQVPEADRLLLQAAARVVLVGGRDPLDWQLDHSELSWSLPEPLDVTGHPEPEERDRGPDRPDPDLRHFNGLGGFSPDGREYVLLLRDVAGVTVDPRSNGQLIPRAMSRPSLPPAPWINVVANPSCGFLVSEAGSGYTWAGNSQSNRLTPWNNDPVSDPPGEVLYLRDEDTGEVWNPTPLPIPSGAPAVVRHGPGYTTFEKADAGLEHELTLFVPAEDPIKLLLLTVRNPGDRPRRLSATFYAEWVLGTGRDRAPMQVITAVDPETGALLARNPFQGDFPAAVAFADVSLRPHTLTADRTEFLGRNGSVAAPAALGRVELSGRAGAALDPCAAVQAKFDLEPGQHAEIVFCLGQAAGLEEVRALLTRYRDPARARQALAEVQAGWDDRLDAVRVRTPNPAMDLLLNRWLLYQVLACRLWARSALYQSGGAFGFRDQLQDVMALVHAAPREARAQVLRAAARQFVEGDVQHWWHPPAGNGIRTRCSDDYIWLPFVAAYYATATGDAAVLDEVVPYLQGPSLRPGQEDDYGRPETADQSGTLYDHCLRALDRATGLLGAHGLPLMGTCDWNDGMNKVGAEGRGESVWLAWFLLTTLRRFADVAEARGDAERAAPLRRQADGLLQAVEAHAWDGSWYRRAYFDDGTPLGSAQNDECRIDSIAQTWAVISGAGDPERARTAMAAVEEQLVRSDEPLILLFTPPFDAGPLQPGYIKGYVPGIRENGGQYTHAATWVVLATALLGRGRRAVELFDILNPIRHAADPEAVERYKVEPYVVAADIYGRPPHTGRGGWTWYTGSASWLYRVGLEAILGFHRRGDRLVLDPCIPGDWPGYEITYRHGAATYRITVENPEGVERGVRAVTRDGQPCASGSIELTDDGRDHDVRVTMGGGPSSPSIDPPA